MGTLTIRNEFSVTVGIPLGNAVPFGIVGPLGSAVHSVPAVPEAFPYAVPIGVIPVRARTSVDWLHPVP